MVLLNKDKQLSQKERDMIKEYYKNNKVIHYDCKQPYGTTDCWRKTC